jgi:ABC-2 type transport system ATP-binding protein
MGDQSARSPAAVPPAGYHRFEVKSGGIHLEDLTKSYSGPQGPIHAVREINVAVAAGETVALLGPNGAGKSTTIDMILGLSEPDSGSVSVFGLSPHEAVASGAVGGMLQTGGLIRDLTVRELVAMLASLYPAPLEVDAALELTGVLPSPTSAPRRSRAGRRNVCARRSRS